MKMFAGVTDSGRTILKARLKEFWENQQLYSFQPNEEVIRTRATSFVPGGSKVLDVACGRAVNSIWLADRAQYFGVDISLNFLRHAQRPDLNLICADAEALPFRSNCFDLVIATYVLEHSTNPISMLSEMARVVRSEGKVVLLGPCWDFPFWYPNSLLTRARHPVWRLSYTARRFSRQIAALFGGPLHFMVVDKPDAFSQPFEYDSDAVYVAWSYEIIRQTRKWGLRLVSAEADDQLLGKNSLVKWLKRVLMLLPIYRYAGSTILMVFEKC